MKIDETHSATWTLTYTRNLKNQCQCQCEFLFRTYRINVVDFGKDRADGKCNKSELHDLRFSDGHKKLKGVELSVLLDVDVDVSVAVGDRDRERGYHKGETV